MPLDTFYSDGVNVVSFTDGTIIAPPEAADFHWNEVAILWDGLALTWGA